jgi:hypothetical protein
MDHGDGPLSPKLPPPPRESSPVAREVPYPAGNNPEVKGLRKFLTILGVIGGFNFGIVPGLFGVRRYRNWKHGEIQPPTGWMIWGVVYVAFMILTVVAQAVGEM